jgi:PAS domain S-box-containing protein
VLYDTAGNAIRMLGSMQDITERKQFETTLKESEERFRSFADNITNLAWIADGEGWIYWYNQRWYHYTGTTLDEMQGWGWEKVHHPDHIGHVMAFVKEAWKRDEPLELTFPLRRHDGVYRWFLTRAVPVKNEAGTIYRWIGTNTDIHEQKMAEDRFRTLAETLPQLVWMTDAAGTYEYASHTGRNTPALIPRSENAWVKNVHPEDWGHSQRFGFVAWLPGETYRADVRLINKEGPIPVAFCAGRTGTGRTRVKS